MKTAALLIWFRQIDIDSKKMSFMDMLIINLYYIWFCFTYIFGFSFELPTVNENSCSSEEFNLDIGIPQEQKHSFGLYNYVFGFFNG